jgi:hypothetical protein
MIPFFKTAVKAILAIFSVSFLFACKTRLHNDSAPSSLSSSAHLTLESFALEVPTSEREIVQRVEGAVVAIADYNLIRADFSELSHESNESIDQYLLKSYAFFSKPHIDFTRGSQGYKINSLIPTGMEQKQALRPPFYGRALMIPGATGRKGDADKKESSGYSSEAPLVDAKGAGNPEPEQIQDYHGNGQAFLGEALREFHFQKLIQVIFDREGKGWKTNPVYAVLLLPFSAEHDFGTHLQSALILRKAAYRNGEFTNHGGFVTYSKGALIDEVAKAEAVARELALRRYGLTSTVEMNLDENTHLDAVNLQFTRDKSLIDFGSFGVVSRFENPIVFCNARYRGDINKETIPLRFTGFDVLDCPFEIGVTGKQFLMEPEPELAISKSLWGIGPITTMSFKLLPADKRPKARVQFLDNPSLAGSFLSGEFKKSSARGKQEAQLQHCRFLMPVLKKLQIPKNSVATTRECNPKSDRNAEIAIQFQATLALAGFVNSENLGRILKEKFKDFDPRRLKDDENPFNGDLTERWQSFFK